MKLLKKGIADAASELPDPQPPRLYLAEPYCIIETHFRYLYAILHIGYAWLVTGGQEAAATRASS
jgi:hypothetical protein